MNATLEMPRPVKVRPVSIKAALVAQITAAIEAAPRDSAEVAKCRKRLPGRKTFTHEVNMQERQRGELYLRRAEGVALQLTAERVAKITFKAGPVSYTVWNTRETLEGFLSRVKRAFP